MIASWMLFALLVSTMLAAAAWIMEEVCRLGGVPVRWVWLGAMVTTVGLIAVAPLRTPAPDITQLTPTVAIPEPVAAADLSESIRWPSLTEALATARAAVAQPLRAAAALGEGDTGRALAAGWIVLSLTLLGIAAATLLRSHGARRLWPLREVAGTPVRVAPKVGPAVLGLHRPEVVVPEWLLQAPPEEQRLVVVHEQEHIRARDPLLLAAGCLSVALIPWNPFAWWMLRRLRLAVEMDCDTRVLRGGVRPQAYGSLLIDMAGRGPGLSLGVPALAGSPSTLERRLRAMTTRLPRYAAMRASVLGTLGLAALIAACETRMPTAPEIETMDVAAVETQAKRFDIISKDGSTTYILDGRQVSAEEARKLGGDRIARMEMIRSKSGDGAEFHVSTVSTRLPGAEAGSQDAADRLKVESEMVLDSVAKEKRFSFRSSGQGGNRVTTLYPSLAAGDTGKVRVRVGNSNGPPPLVIVDGVTVESSRLNGIDPDQIKAIEVLKGATATRLYTDPRAANGVIRITTKTGETRP